MKLYLLVAATALFVGCNSKSKTEKKIEADTSAIIPKYADKEPTVPSGKIDIETFGDVKIGQSYAEAISLIGNPDSRGKEVDWAADGLVHQDIHYKPKGLTLNICWEKNNPGYITKIWTITAESPCTFKTMAGMGLGNTYSEVEAAYKRDIDPEATDKTQITVGSVYGGIIFSFTNDKVSKIFIGAEAE